MARALIKGMEYAGHEVNVVSQLRSFSKTPHTNELRAAAEHKAGEIISRWGADRPDLWFSYHPYYKAPDFVALAVLKTLDIPVFTAEASLATRRDKDEWHNSQKAVRELLQRSATNFYFTDRDVAGLQTEVHDNKLVYLPPFIDVSREIPKKLAVSGPVQLITIGMMRAGVKTDSYKLLAKSLKRIAGDDWQLTIVGDGKQRSEVETMFDGFQKTKITWAGEVAPDKISNLLSAADVFVWPGFGEAYGIAYLEAQAAGLPVVAQNTHGVPFVVKDGETGILVALGNDEAYAQAMLNLIKDANLRSSLGENAAKFIRRERNLENASLILDAAIKRVCS